jgi:hypothetical protein
MKVLEEIPFFPPSTRSIKLYRERHAPLVHIEAEAKAGFFTPVTKTIKGYRARLTTAYRNLAPSIRRANTNYSIAIALSLLTIAATTHA